MFNKFKDGETVIVSGIGKCNGKKYKNKIAKVICRDPYFLDYNVKFKDGTEDWLDKKYLKKYKGDKKL